MAPDVGTRGHQYKIMHQHSDLESRKRYFGNRCVKLWNSLPADIVVWDVLLDLRGPFMIIWEFSCLTMRIEDLCSLVRLVVLLLFGLCPLAPVVFCLLHSFYFYCSFAYFD